MFNTKYSLCKLYEHKMCYSEKDSEVGVSTYFYCTRLPLEPTQMFL